MEKSRGVGRLGGEEEGGLRRHGGVWRTNWEAAVLRHVGKECACVVGET